MAGKMAISGVMATSTELNNILVTPSYLMIESGKVRGVSLYYTRAFIPFSRISIYLDYIIGYLGTCRSSNNQYFELHSRRMCRVYTCI